MAVVPVMTRWRIIIFVIIVLASVGTIAVPALPFHALAAFIFGFAVEDIFVSDVRPPANLLRLNIRLVEAFD